jgi:O-acetylhomoserine/O-acetylserine sulfhydrylase-like pyridoxal-dependent enzyme
MLIPNGSRCSTAGPELRRRRLIQATKPLGPIAHIIKAGVTLLRDVGALLSPHIDDILADLD